MKIYKNCLLVILFVCFSVVISGNSYAFLNDIGRFYIQANGSVNLYSKLTTEEDVKSVDDDNKTTINTKISDYTSSFYNPNFNSDLILGFHDLGNFSYEFEFSSFDIHYNELNGDTVGNANAESTDVKTDLFSANVRYDVFSVYDFTVFTKVGAGVIQINQYQRNTAGGNELEFAYQGSVGVFYSYNSHLDIETSFRLLGNVSKKKPVAAVSVEKLKYTYFDSSFLFGLRFNL